MRLPVNEEGDQVEQGEGGGGGLYHIETMLSFCLCVYYSVYDLPDLVLLWCHVTRSATSEAHERATSIQHNF